MISLIRIHFAYLYTSKVRYLTTFIIFFSFIILLYLSNLWQNQTYLHLYRTTYIKSFQSEGLHIIKLIIVLYITLISIQSILFHKYDMFLIHRCKRTLIILSKDLVLIVISGIFGLILFAIYIMLLRYLGLNIGINEILSMLLRVFLLVSFYCTFLHVLLLFYSHVVIGFIPVIGFFISSYSVDFGSCYSELSVFTKVFHFLFVDLFIINGEAVFLYGMVYVLAITSILTILLVRIYERIDF